MTRRPRKTQPQDTRLGLLIEYEEIEQHLITGEIAGRAWIYDRSRQPLTSPYLTDQDIYDLHKAAFSHLYDWAGLPRTEDVGPGGIVYVRSFEVRVKLRELGQDFRYWYAALDEAWTLPQAAELLARTHHGFEYIHPFPDTNGRTGRLLDHFVLWVSLGLSATRLANTPQLEHFPDAQAEGDYFEGLHDASNRRDYRLLSAYYLARLEEALAF